MDQAVKDMQARAAVMAGRQRSHTPTAEYPFVVVLVDEVAFLTAYMPDKQLRERVKAALATLTTDRAHWQAALAEARRRAQEADGNLSATGKAA